MAMMAKMRSLAPAFIITVGALFVLFMIISDSNVLEALGGRTNSIGSVNGEEITYNEYADLLNQQLEMQKNQTGQDLNEEQMDQLREQVWDALVTQKLVSQKMSEYNISVSDQEVQDIILGNDPPQFLKQNFIDSAGNFNRQMYEAALFDERNRDALLQAEEYVRQQRLSEKLQSLLLASITVSEQEIKRKYIEQSTSINAQYALIDVNQYPDSLFSVTDEDLKNYYNENLDKYKVEAQRKLKYVMFNVAPSPEDSASARKTLENVLETYKNDTLSFKAMAEIYSTVPYGRDTLLLSAFPENVASEFQNAKAGTIIGPVVAPEGMAVYNVINVIPSNEPVARVSHILLNQFGNDEQNLAEANKIYEQLKNGADFAEFAKKYSQDPGSAQRGGDLGWFGKGAMVPEFEKASFEGKVDEVQAPVKTSYGYHIVKVTGRSNNKFVVEKIVNQLEASATTRDMIQSQANDFAYLAEKNGFGKEAELMKYQVQETMPFTKEAYSIPGIGTNKRLVTWAFENDVNDVSEVHRTPTGFVVTMISEVNKEGARPFDEVKEQIRPVVLREKKFERALKKAEDLYNKMNGDLNKIVSIDPKVAVQTTGSFTPGGTVPTVGRDYAFIETALDLNEGSVSKPVKGFRGYYIIKVIEKTKFDNSNYEIQRNTLRDQILQEKRNTYFNQWLAKLKEDAEIVDNRRFD